MTRLRSGGRFSRLKPSPRQNSVGGVERSTSRTNPGRGMLTVLGPARSKAILMAPRRPAAAAWAMASTCSSSGYVALKPPLGLDGVGGLDGEVERLDAAAVGEVLGAVGVGADQLGLAVPQPGQVERHLGRHAHQHDAPARTGDGEGVGDRAFGADGVDRGVGAGRQVVADQSGSRRCGGRLGPVRWPARRRGRRGGGPRAAGAGSGRRRRRGRAGT